MTRAEITVYAEGISPAEKSTPEFDSLQIGLAGLYAANGPEEYGVEYRCKHCKEPLKEQEDNGPLQSFSRNPEFCYANEKSDSHEKEFIPLSWANWAGLSLNDEEDSVRLQISVGELRGCMEFTVRRMPDGRLIMHTPYPSDGTPHVYLSPLHDGTFEILSK